MDRATVVAVIIGVFSLFNCGNNSERANAEKVNEEKFHHHKEKEANFVIDILDTSYGLINVAQIGEAKLHDPALKAQIQKIIQGHTSAMVKLKTYAENRGITIPLSGPRKTKSNIKRLENQKAANFNDAWVKEMKELQHKLKTDIEGYQRKSVDTALIHVLDSTLLMVKHNNEIITDFEINNSKESI